jgi:hypothetical protein
MVPTDEELEQQRQHVADLREKISAAQADAEASLRDKEREIEGARLDAEAAKLEADLAAVLAAGNKKTIDAGVAGLIETSATELANAEARAKEQEITAKAQAEAAKNAEKVDPETVGVPQDELDRRAAAEKEAAKAKEKSNGNGGNS